MNVVNASDLSSGTIGTDAACFVHLTCKPAPEAAKPGRGAPPSGVPADPRPLHRLGDVRRREGLTLHAVARQLGISIEAVKHQEDPASDLRLSDLYRWEEVLQVPASELLREPGGDLSPPVQLRARLLRIMKTARSIEEQARQISIRRLTAMLIEQIVSVMPELKDTAAWPTVGQRRSHRELGQAYHRGLMLDPKDIPDAPAE